MKTLKQVKINLIKYHLKKADYNKSEAIKTLGLSRSTFYRYVDKYNIDLNGEIK